VVAKCSYVMPYKEITKKKEHELISNIKTGCKESEKELFNNKINLIIKLIQKYSLNSNWIEMNDLIHEAYFGFRKAVDKYNGEFAFNTYLRQWVIAKAQMFYHRIKGGMSNKTPYVNKQVYIFVGGDTGYDLMYSDYDTEPGWMREPDPIDFNRFTELTKGERRAIDLYINKKKTVIQMAKDRGVTKQAIFGAVLRAKTKLKKHFLKNVLTYPSP